MRISSARIRNYRSILDSGPLSFSPGFNVIVGANNVGKSSLLLCLAGSFSADPHRSIETLPTRDEHVDPISRVDFTIVASGSELRQTVLGIGGGPHHLPWPADTPPSNEHLSTVMERLSAAKEIPLYGSVLTRPDGQRMWEQQAYPATRLYEPRIDNGAHRMIRFTGVRSTRSLVPQAVLENGSADSDIGLPVAQQMAAKIYRFSAERMSLGRASYSASQDLVPDAQNLAAVLNLLQSNPARFKEFNELVTEVLPTIRAISVRTTRENSNQGEILVWQVDPSLQRDDLAMPLEKCGTGVGQVLAMIYVAKTSEQGRTIIIDEPGSFLHPGAARALIQVLKRFPQHQYIVATHSPEILAELADAPLTMVRWQDSSTSIQQFPSTTSKVAGAALTEVGARLSDVFGFDRVLWVEGPSDALAFKALLEITDRLPHRLAILPVRDTGAFRRRKVAEILEIYRTLSMGDALLPPALLFLFDRDGRTEKEIEDVSRESKGRVAFLSYRMLENYLLQPIAIAKLFNECGAAHSLSTTTEAVDSWISTNGASLCSEANVQVGSDAWRKCVDGATLLENLFADISGATLEYRKTTHTPRLAVLSYGTDKAAAERLLAELGGALSQPNR
jgi:energy-coupling factor transporter ATP-binding protein EcfA2